MKFIDRIPLGILVAIAIWMAIAPISPQPHLLEKISMLMAGELVRPLDIFDLFLHGTPQIVLAIKLYRLVKHKRQDN